MTKTFSDNCLKNRIKTTRPGGFNRQVLPLFDRKRVVCGLVLMALSAANAAVGADTKANEILEVQVVKEVKQYLLPKAFQPVSLSALAARLYQAECLSQPRYLTHWNKGEDFASFGIGHFIWLPKSYQGKRFVETFPDMLAYVSRIHALPLAFESLRQQQQGALPWPTPAAFKAAQNSEAMQALRTWLLNTQPAQAAFVLHQFEVLWQKRFQHLSPMQQQQVAYYRVALSQFDAGLYALVDYSHFKGMGQLAAEQYQQKGWGLLDVLLAMPKPNPGEMAKLDISMTLLEPLPSSSQASLLNLFKLTAKQCLRQRVELAPSARNEQLWLAGWLNRIERY